MTETLPADWEHLEAAAQPPCELDHHDTRCGQPATHIMTWTIPRREPLHIFACSPHADAALRHYRHCTACPRMFRLTVETIGRLA